MKFDFKGQEYTFPAALSDITLGQRVAFYATHGKDMERMAKEIEETPRRRHENIDAATELGAADARRASQAQALGAEALSRAEGRLALMAARCDALEKKSGRCPQNYFLWAQRP